MRRAKNLLLLLLIITMCIGMFPATANADTLGSGAEESEYIANGVESINLREWLSYMPDETPISRLNLLGSHDAGCFNPMPIDKILIAFPGLYILLRHFTADFAQTQTLSIPDQLNNGVRVLDLRGGCYLGENNPFELWVNHKLPMLDSDGSILTIDRALKQVESFLKAHPTETVVVMLNDESIIYPDKTVKLIKQAAEESPYYYENFEYYKSQSAVPTLGEVRGKCVVLCLKDEPRPVTKYEDHYSATLSEKKSYLTKFFNAHNSGDPLYSNKTAAYYNDIFTKENYDNEDGKMGNPQVKLAYYSANAGPIGDLPYVYKELKRSFGDSSYLSEVRYGWIFQDWIGEDDPIKGIISSNTGCTNYYASLDFSDCAESPYFIYFTKDCLKVFQKSGDEKTELEFLDDKLHLEKNGNNLEITIIGLPLYSEDGTRFEYTVEIENEVFQLTQLDTNMSDEYQVRDGKWCGRIITETAKIEKITTEFPLEIQFVIDEEVSEWFKEPQDNNAFNDICRGIEFIRNPGNTKYTVFSYTTDYTAHLSDFEVKYDDDGKRYYETKVVNLPSGAKEGTGSQYSYTLNRVLIYNKETANYTLHSEIKEGKTGPRIVVEVHGRESKKLVKGTIHWWDGNDYFSRRDTLLSDGSGSMLPIEMNKYTTAHPDMKDYVSFSKYLITEKNTTSIEYYTQAFDFQGLEFECSYVYRDTLLNGHYIKTTQKDNEVTYVLNGKADFSVVWNKEPPEEITSRTVTVTSKDGESILFTADKDSETTSGSAKIWTSETCMLPLYVDEETAAEYIFKKAEDMKLDGYAYKVQMTTDIDEDGIICYHFYLIYDKIKGDTWVSGRIIWIDGIEKDHTEENKKIKIIPIVDDQEGEEVDLSNMTWEGNEYTICLPSYTDDGSEITYIATMPSFTGYTKQQSNYDFKFTKQTSAMITKTNDISYIQKNSEQLRLYRNDTEIPEAVFDKSRNGYSNLPIADENNILYSYNILLDTDDPEYVVKSEEPNFNEKTGITEVEINVYKCSEQVLLPLRLNVVGIDTEEDFEFVLEGETDEGSFTQNIKLKANSSDSFEIPGKSLLKNRTTYKFSIHQVIPESEEISYDDHVSDVKVYVEYRKPLAKCIAVVSWTDSVEDKAGTSIFTNRKKPLEYSINVINGSSNKDKAAKGETVSVSVNAEDIPDGMQFNKWVSLEGNVSFADDKASETTFIMPEEEVTVKAELIPLESPVEEYPINVINGMADKDEAPQDDTVRIIVAVDDIPDGMQFDKWISLEGDVEFADEGETETTFTMPAEDVTVKAELKPIESPVIEYAINVINGTADRTEAAEGDMVNVKVNTEEIPDGMQFDKWVSLEGDISFEDEKALETTFTMPANEVTIKAKLVPIESPVTEYAVNVINGIADKMEAAEGETVSITADKVPDGMKIDKWASLRGSVEFKDEKVLETTFVMPASDVVVKANLTAIESPVTEYAISVINGTADKAEAAEGETINVTIDEIPDGMQFFKWASFKGDVSFAEEYEPMTTFVMPETEVIVKAVLIPLESPTAEYTVNVTNGTADKSEAAEGETVKVMAGEIPDGMKFDKWTALKGKVTFSDASAAETTFVMPASDVFVKAEFSQIVIPTPTPTPVPTPTPTPVPTYAPTPGPVSTGDDNNTWLWISLLLISTSAIVALAGVKKKY